jgi:GT2 family glycosyltransferase
VSEFASEHPDLVVEYIDPETNTGPAGAMHIAMTRVLTLSSPDDWLFRLDDDKPLRCADHLETLVAECRRAMELSDRVAAVGEGGSLFSWRSGRMRRPMMHDSRGLVEVDYLATNCYPLFRLEAVRAVGTFDPDLFFGVTELEYGLRLRRADFVLYRTDRWATERRPSRARLSLADRDWRRYYSLRNQIAVLRRYGHPGTALQVSVVRGVAKPLFHLPRRPRQAVRALGDNLRAIKDGWQGTLGRTIDPDEWLGAVEEAPHT